MTIYAVVGEFTSKWEHSRVLCAVKCMHCPWRGRRVAKVSHVPDVDTLEEFAQALEGKGDSKRCPKCNGSVWAYKALKEL